MSRNTKLTGNVERCMQTIVSPEGRAQTLLLVDLHDPSATDPTLVGGKAAALARALRAGLDVLPGVVLTTAFAESVDTGADLRTHPALLDAFALGGGDQHAVVVRSSSVIEDTAASSMAGQFASVIGVSGVPAFADAVGAVLDSRVTADAAGSPIGVLVQPLLEPAFGGVLFGVDPVSGRSDRRVVTAVAGGPEPLVSGLVDGSRYVLDDTGRVLEFQQNDGPSISKDDLQRLVALAATAAGVFGGPQDVEWAITTAGDLHLLQSRPVTTEVRGVPSGPVYGPGPVAETFPEPLTELEHDLWVPPLRDAVREAVLLAGAAPANVVDSSEIVITVAGRVAIDLRLSGDVVPRQTLVHRLNPVPSIRRLRAAWRVGRLRAALPGLSDLLLDRVDADLEAMPALSTLSTRQVIALLHRSRAVLRSLHAHEILLGMLTDTGGNRMTGASVALRVLVEARNDGLTDAEILARSPIVLALAPPRIAPAPALPREAVAIDLGEDHQSSNDMGILREALRLRVRWVQELTGRAAWELGERLTASNDLTEPELIRHLTIDHLEAVATKRAVLVPSLAAPHDGFGEPLPAQFQLSDLGKPIRVEHDREATGGTGAGGGIGRGPVTFDVNDPPAGSVLVTTTLSPTIGPLLSRLAGIVAETGSVLSHLSILAREAGVAIVVGYPGAVDELTEGTVVVVDGESGRVTIEGEGA